MKIHTGYKDDTMENDIAVAKVRRDLPLGPNVKRVVITKQYPERGRQGFVAGWGLVRVSYSFD